MREEGTKRPSCLPLHHICYLDSANVPTIGYGHTKTLTRADVGRLVIDEAQAQRLLEEDLIVPSAASQALGLTGPRYVAIASFVYNLGIRALHGRQTQIARHLINGNYDKAVAGMKRYVFAAGQRSPGLIARRDREAALVN